MPLLALAMMIACGQPTNQETEAEAMTDQEPTGPEILNGTYIKVPLTTDMSKLTDQQAEMVQLMILAARIMDEIFWMESYGNKEELLAGIQDEEMRKFAAVNYGPWDRLDGNAPFIDGVGPKPKGANYYPHDMTGAEFEALEDDRKYSLYTVIKRDEQGELMVVTYPELYMELYEAAANYLRTAGDMAMYDPLREYLYARSEALISGEYDASDRLWLEMKDNVVDIIIGPIENYEDQLYGYKAAHEAYVLVKDVEWSEKLARYVQFLPELQEGLPVDDQYKAESPGTSSQLNAYDVVYYAGDCNAGSKTIAVNLPNDETIQQEMGTRRSQLKNAMKAKFDHILLPISEVLIAESQRQHITFDAFFSNTMFHEVAHGLGIKNTINGKGSVRAALKEQYSALEEGKADILGLYMITALHEKGELGDADLMDNYVTFMASIFRSVRFGASSAHGKANMLRFNYFEEQGAFVRDEATGQYAVDMEKMKSAMASLSGMILQLQGDGDYDAVVQLMEEKGGIGTVLQGDLNRLTEQKIPVDVVFEQGPGMLGLNETES